MINWYCPQGDTNNTYLMRYDERGDRTMKRLTFTGTIENYRRLPLSVNGNPAYWATFVNEEGETLTGRTASDAMCAYGFLNWQEKPRTVTYHITAKGNVIFDYIEILGE